MMGNDKTKTERTALSERTWNGMDYREDYYRGLGGIYFRRVLKMVIELGKLETENGLILDFGCGVGHLKRVLGKNVMGFDIIQELSDVKDYRKLRPRVIVCNNVLEHFDLDKVEKTVQEFRKMKPDRIVTATPTENWLSRVGMALTGENAAHSDHKSKLADINRTIEKYCSLIERKRVMTMSEVSLWKFGGHMINKGCQTAI